MDELDAIFDKYRERPLRWHFETLEEINQFALCFDKDVAEIYDCLSRVKNTERNPSGYTLDDAPIIGPLVRIWKLLKETIRYHAENNAEFVGIFQRTLIETAVTATYLLKRDAAVLEDYRKCSYKDRLRIPRDSKMDQSSPRLRRASASCAPSRKRCDLKVFQRTILPNRRRIGGSYRAKISFPFLRTSTTSKCTDAASE
jgi:hypothetical protein